MLEIAISQLKATMDASGLFERYAGLTMPLKRVSRETEASTKTEVFPVACDVSNTNCWETGQYKQLSPDSSIKSVAYWERVNEVSPFEYLGQVEKWKGKARFVVVANIKNLNLNSNGATDCDISPYFFGWLYKNIHCAEMDLTHPAFTNARVMFEMTGQKAPFNAFDKYSYDPAVISAVFLYPMQVMVFEFDVTITISPGCYQEPTLGAAIDC